MGSGQIEVLRAADAERLGGLRKTGEFFWLDLAIADVPDPGALARALEVSDSAIEAVTSPPTTGAPARKIHVESELIAFPFWCAIPDRRGHGFDLARVNVLLHGDFLLTIHRRAIDLPAVVAEFAPGRSERYAVYAALDGMTDTVLDALAAIEGDIATLETRLLGSGLRSRPADKELATRLRRRLTTLRMHIGPERALFERVSEEIEEIDTLEGDHREYFGRIQSQLDRAVERIDAAREALSDALQAQLNETTYRLTLVATIFLPLSFVTGFFGMNFLWLTDRIDSGAAFWVIGVGSLLIPLVFIVVFLELGLLRAIVRRVRE